ncbi:riboflavin synthase [Desulfococcus sp.]|uniref:riboflavin synthase n=1 Tax=Desulfococcus sp. TaxID=2025834 RepID=UPI003593B7E1
MFTGIIEGLGTIRGIQPSGEGCKLAVDADFALAGTRLGDSIAVNGACLTAVALNGRSFTVDVSPETMARTTFGRMRAGDRVNLERALRLSDRLDGHLVSGHIDGMGSLADRKARSNAIIISFRVPRDLTRYMIPKGSVAVDGVSLTINAVTADGFEVSLIPLTARLTTVGMKAVGDAVNIETDMIGKYVERFVTGGKPKTAAGQDGVDIDFLARHGFL